MKIVVPNQGVISPLTQAAMFVVATVDPGREDRVHDALDNLSGLTRSVGFRYPEKQLSLTTSFGSDAWDRLFSGPKPKGLHPFVELDGPRHRAPSTPGDVLFHVKASTLDMCFELSWRILEAHVDDVLARGLSAPGHVVNLGHGVPPDTDPDVLTRIVELVHDR